eukprot:GILJ01007495.1.p1 GENE.GILJ01007495.1~~GILJ01007495.1.p1  ORF type:complete len:374 (+),score=43.11 GILJ01007495.1:68-1123(+)
MQHFLVFVFAVLLFGGANGAPIVVNTWPFTSATERAFQVVMSNASAMDGLVAGCTVCEEMQCDGTVGFGGSPDENGETTLEALVFDGTNMDMGAVASLRRIKNVIAVARAVMDYTSHSILAGDLATKFALQMGFKEEDLSTVASVDMWKQWKENTRCQPNFWRNVMPDSATTCGPYTRPQQHIPSHSSSSSLSLPVSHPHISYNNHDTLAMIVIDKQGHIAAGTTTNGARFHISGRVGDSPIIGAGAYADSDIGGCGATGDGDVMMRFLPCYQAVENMRQGMSPQLAAENSIERIRRKFPNFIGAVVVVNKAGEHGAACNGWTFTYSVQDPSLDRAKVFTVQPVLPKYIYQ